MAKEKGGFNPAVLKKHYFWIVLPLLVILAFVFSFIARGAIKKAYEEKTTAIQSAKEGADSVASDKKHPNDATIKAIKSETSVLADNVYGAWELMYNDQKIRNRWPRQLSSEFLDLVENKLKFKDPIGVGKPYLLEDYGYFIGRHLPDLIKEMNRRRCQVMEYKLLKKAELNSLQLNYDERFWPIYVDKDADGNEFLYIGIHSNIEDEESPLADAYLYNRESDIVSKFESKEQYDAILKKAKHEHYYLDVDPWILMPKDNIIYGVAANDLQGIVQAISSAGTEGGAAGGGGGAMMGGGSSGMMGSGMSGSGGMGGSGGARGSMGGDSMSGGMGGGLAGLGIGAVPGDGYDPAAEQVVGTSLEELGGGGLGAGGGMGSGRAGGGMGSGMTGGGMGGARTSMAGGGMGGARTSMAGGASMSGGRGGMGGDSMGGASAEDPSWSQKIFPGLPSYKERRRIVGNVDWPDPEVYTLPTWEQTAAHPESIEVWYAQETLWVYEALIRVIADTNKDYPDNISKAPIKCVEQMLIGQNAAVEWLTLSQTIGDLTGKSAAGNAGMGTDSMSSGMMGSSSAGMMGGSGEGMFSLSGNAEEQAMTKILTGRYIGEDNTPLKAEDKPPYSEFNMMPVCLKLAIDQRHIPDLLVSCANSAMPIDVKHVRVSPDNNVPFVMPIPLENMTAEGGAGGASAMMGGGMMGGGMMGGSMSGSGSMGGDSAAGGRGGRGAANGMGGAAGDMGGMGGIEIGRSELSQTEYGVDTIRVELYGVINIFNKPNKEAFATGASAEEADAEAEAALNGETKSEGETTNESGATDATVTENATDSGAATTSSEPTAAEPAPEPAATDANATDAAPTN